MNLAAKCTQEGEAEAATSGSTNQNSEEDNTLHQQQPPPDKDAKEALLGNNDAKELGRKGAATTNTRNLYFADPIVEIQPLPLMQLQGPGQPALERRLHIDRQPGAYLGAPGVNPQRLQHLPFALVGAIGADANGEPEPTLAGQENESEVISGAFLVGEDREAIVSNAIRTSRDSLNDGREVIEGRAISANQARRPLVSNKRFSAAVVSVLVVVASAVVLLVVVLFSASDSTASPALPEDDQSTIYPPFQEGLRETLLRAIEDQNSHYYSANYWMLQDPNLDLYTPERQFQRFQMAFFYYFTNGDNWFRNDGWMSYDVSECDWYSSSPLSRRTETPICDGNGNMKVLNMTSNNLQGNFTELTDYVSGVVYLDISNNHLSGLLPPIVGNHPTVEFIIANNSFSGFMVASGGYSSHEIKVIRTDSNMFGGGSAPGFYYLLPKLEVFNNSGNNYQGPLDKSLASCKHLRSYSTKCDHVGTIPSEYGQLTTLEEFEIGGNSRMTGTIPSELGLLTNLALLDISETGIRGVIPKPLCRRELEGLLQIKANCTLVECCE